MLFEKVRDFCGMSSARLLSSIGKANDSIRRHSPRTAYISRRLQKHPGGYMAHELGVAEIRSFLDTAKTSDSLEHKLYKVGSLIFAYGKEQQVLARFWEAGMISPGKSLRKISTEFRKRLGRDGAGEIRDATTRGTTTNRRWLNRARQHKEKSYACRCENDPAMVAEDPRKDRLGTPQRSLCTGLITHDRRSYRMRLIVFLVVTVATVAGVVVFTAPASGDADEEAAPIFGIKIPAGYRDWRLISVAHEAGNLNDLRAILGNDAAIKAYREGKLPFPDGTIIARLAWSYVPSEENNKVFGRPQSFVAGPPTTGGFNLWSRTQENTPRPVAGGSLNSTTANPPTRRCTKPALPATSLPKLATLSSPTTHLSAKNRKQEAFARANPRRCARMDLSRHDPPGRSWLLCTKVDRSFCQGTVA